MGPAGWGRKAVLQSRGGEVEAMTSGACVEAGGCGFAAWGLGGICQPVHNLRISKAIRMNRPRSFQIGGPSGQHSPPLNYLARSYQPPSGDQVLPRIPHSHHCPRVPPRLGPTSLPSPDSASAHLPQNSALPSNFGAPLVPPLVCILRSAGQSDIQTFPYPFVGGNTA